MTKDLIPTLDKKDIKSRFPIILSQELKKFEGFTKIVSNTLDTALDISSPQKSFSTKDYAFSPEKRDQISEFLKGYNLNLETIRYKGGQFHILNLGKKAQEFE